MKNKVDRQGSIYVLHCLVNDKEYVGQTIMQPPEVRWAGHISSAFVKKSTRPLYCAMRKYGLSKFTAEIIWSGSESKLNSMERKFIRERKTFIDTGWGYNLTTGGDHFKLSRRSIRKIRKALVGYYIDNPARRKVIGIQSTVRMKVQSARVHLSKMSTAYYSDPIVRKRMSVLVRHKFKKDSSISARISEASIRQWASPAARAEKSLVSKRGWEVRRKNGTDRVVYGKRSPHTQRAKVNMTAAQLKRFENPAECKKISDGQLRRYQNPEAHAKSSAAQYRRFAEHPVSTVMRAHQSAAAKAVWADPIKRASILAARQSRTLLKGASKCGQLTKQELETTGTALRLA